MSDGPRSTIVLPREVVLDGTRVAIETATHDGVSHTGLFGKTHDGTPVFIKIETDSARLATEAAALKWAATHAIPVPAVIGFGVAKVDGARKVVLMTERVTNGVRPIDPAGWRRMGMALAKLADVPIDGCPLRSSSAAEFADEQRSKLDAVRHLLPGGLASDTEGAIERIRTPRFTPVFTHGDPGGGNFLCTEGGDVLLDWESAMVGPFGLDFGRACFIALLDIQGTGQGRLLAQAVRDGYLSSVRGQNLDDEDQRAWKSVAGLQFICGRWSRRGQARVRSYVDAIAVLEKLE